MPSEVCAVMVAEDFWRSESHFQPTGWCLHPKFIARDATSAEEKSVGSRSTTRTRTHGRSMDGADPHCYACGHDHPYGGPDGTEVAVPCPACATPTPGMRVVDSPRVCDTCHGIEFVSAPCCEHSREDHIEVAADGADLHCNGCHPHREDGDGEYCEEPCWHIYDPGGAPLAREEGVAR